MKTKVVRAGNSRAIIIPAAVADELGWPIGKEVEIQQLPSAIVVRVKPRRPWKTTLKRVIGKHVELLKELAKR